jgi:hypothetical protein
MRYRRNKNTSSDHLVAFVIYLLWKTDFCNTYFLYVVLAFCEIGLLHLGFFFTTGWLAIH